MRYFEILPIDKRGIQFALAASIISAGILFPANAHSRPARNATASSPAAPTQPRKLPETPSGRASIDKAIKAGVYAESDDVVEQIRALGDKALDGDETAMTRLMAKAQQGNAFAQSTLGFFCLLGRAGVPQDDKQAAQWFRKAAEQGETDSQGMMGLFYANGRGVPRDYGLAALWLTLAASHHDHLAQLNLGSFFAAGKGGVPQNNVVAYALFDLSGLSDLVDDDSGNDPVFSKQFRASFVKGLTQQEIKDGKALSREMSRSGDVVKAINQYLYGHDSKRP